MPKRPPRQRQTGAYCGIGLAVTDEPIELAIIGLDPGEPVQRLWYLGRVSRVKNDTIIAARRVDTDGVLIGTSDIRSQDDSETIFACIGGGSQSPTSKVQAAAGRLAKIMPGPYLGLRQIAIAVLSHTRPESDKW